MNELTTNEETVSLTKEAIIKEAKRIEENILYTSKGHFAASNFWDNFHLYIGVPTIILAAIAGAISFAQFDYHNLFSGILAIIVVILTSITTFLNPKKRADTHLSSGNNYDSLLSRVRIFWTIECRNENSEIVLTNNLKVLSSERDRLNRDCPQVPKFAYLKAKKGIEEGEALFQVDVQ